MIIFLNSANNSGDHYRNYTFSHTTGHLTLFPDPESEILIHTPNIFTSSPYSFLALSVGTEQHASSKASPRSPELDEATSLTAQHVLDSTEILNFAEEQLLYSCESAKTICDSEDVVVEVPHTSSISIGEEQEAQTEQKGSVSTGSVVEEVMRRPDSLKGIQSFQRSHRDLASLGLAFPAQNSSMAVAHWPSITDRTVPNDDAESYTYSPGYDQTRSKANDR